MFCPKIRLKYISVNLHRKHTEDTRFMKLAPGADHVCVEPAPWPPQASRRPFVSLRRHPGGQALSRYLLHEGLLRQPGEFPNIVGVLFAISFVDFPSSRGFSL